MVFVRDTDYLLTMTPLTQFTLKTSEKSAMYISVYKSQEDAENALDGRQKYVDAMGDLVHDVFYHEGDMDFAFLDPEMLKHEMVDSL